MTDIEKINKHQFYFETSLYQPISYSNLEHIFQGEVEGYNSIEKIDTTFDIKVSNSTSDLIVKDEGVFSTSDLMAAAQSSLCGGAGYRAKPIEKDILSVKLICKRKSTPYIFFLLLLKDNLVKIGQTPSLADIQFAKLGKKYNKILPEEDLKNLKKAIGLHAHGAGAGSFVYLRRIFENLIRSTFNSNESSLSIKRDDFMKMYMSDKIAILKDYLPEQLVKMSQIYGIMSKGVHELTEEDCLKYFSPIKISIELILDQRIEMKAKELKDQQAQKQLDEILKEIKTD